MEDLETASLLKKDSTNINVKPYYGKFSYLIGLMIISAILTVTYFASGYANKSYSTNSELDAQRSKPVASPVKIIYYHPSHKPTPEPTYLQGQPTIHPKLIYYHPSYEPTPEPTYVKGLPTIEPTKTKLIYYHPSYEPTPEPTYVQGVPTAHPSKVNFIYFLPTHEPSPKPEPKGRGYLYYIYSIIFPA
jgi:hypothetical protein